MDQHNPLPTPPQPDPATAKSPASATRAGIQRRTLLRGGAAASPILLTFASGPVAATSKCVVASSFVSASVYQSRNPGSNNIACVTKTAKNHCDDAVSLSEKSCNWNPHTKKVGSYVSGRVDCGSWTKNTNCYAVFRNNGNGLTNTGDTAILQRLLALGFGAPTVFTASYCGQIWAARSSTSALAALVNDGANGWDQTRLLRWLDYSANGVTF